MVVWPFNSFLRKDRSPSQPRLRTHSLFDVLKRMGSRMSYSECHCLSGWDVIRGGFVMIASGMHLMKRQV